MLTLTNGLHTAYGPLWSCDRRPDRNERWQGTGAATWAGLASVDATHRLRAWPQIIDLSGMLRRRDIYSAIIAQAKALGHTIAVFRDGSRE